MALTSNKALPYIAWSQIYTRNYDKKSCFSLKFYISDSHFKLGGPIYLYWVRLGRFWHIRCSFSAKVTMGCQDTITNIQNEYTT